MTIRENSWVVAPVFFIPLEPNCYQFNASVYYYDEGCGCWVVCCISFWLCDPYDCDDIVYAYNGEDGYDLSLPGSGNSNISWYNDDTGELLGSGSSVFIPLEPNCLQFNASVHYYDEGCGCWVVCCISFWLCDPYDCDDIVYAYNG
jgi:hypothetical protein